MPSRMEALAVVSAFSCCSLSSTAPRPHHRLLTTRTLLPPPWAVSSSRAPLVVSHPLPAPVAATHAKVDHSSRFCRPRSAREFALLCKGSELLDRILARGGKFSEEDAKVVMVQIFSVVSFCHLQGVVHRDLKPENFLFTSKDETSALKVIDFGLSDFVKPDERLNDIVGSACYVAPEVLHRSYGTEADMWSVGVIAYIFLCGSRPFWARTESGIFRAVLKAEPSFDEAPWPTLTTEAKDFVKMLLNKDYCKRMTAAQALNQIKNQEQISKLNLQALVKNSTDAMKDAWVVDFVNTVCSLQYRKLDFEEFAASAISVYQKYENGFFPFHTAVYRSASQFTIKRYHAILIILSCWEPNPFYSYNMLRWQAITNNPLNSFNYDRGYINGCSTRPNSYGSSSDLFTSMPCCIFACRCFSCFCPGHLPCLSPRYYRSDISLLPQCRSSRKVTPVTLLCLLLHPFDVYKCSCLTRNSVVVYTRNLGPLLYYNCARQEKMLPM